MSAKHLEPDGEGFLALWPTLFLKRRLPDHETANEELLRLVEDLERDNRDLTTDYRDQNIFILDHPAATWLKDWTLVGNQIHLFAKTPGRLLTSTRRDHQGVLCKEQLAQFPGRIQQTARVPPEIEDQRIHPLVLEILQALAQIVRCVLLEVADANIANAPVEHAGLEYALQGYLPARDLEVHLFAVGSIVALVDGARHGNADLRAPRALDSR